MSTEGEVVEGTPEEIEEGRALGKRVADLVRGALPPGKVFLLFVVDHGDDDKGRVDYVSNIRRADAVQLLLSHVQRVATVEDYDRWTREHEDDDEEPPSRPEWFKA